MMELGKSLEQRGHVLARVERAEKEDVERRQAILQAHTGETGVVYDWAKTCITGPGNDDHTVLREPTVLQEICFGRLGEHNHHICLLAYARQGGSYHQAVS